MAHIAQRGPRGAAKGVGGATAPGRHGLRAAAGPPVAFPDHPSLIPVRLSSFAPVRLVRRGAQTGPTFAVFAPARGDQGGNDSNDYGGSDPEQRGEGGYLQAETLRYELRPDEDQDRGAREHEDRPEHDRPDHAVEEDVVAVALWYGEAGEDHAEHEDVVQREALLQQVGGKVRFEPLHASQEPHEPPEGEGDRDPEHRKPNRLFERHLPRVPVENEEVE